MLETFISFAISLLMGLLIGMERERSHAEGIQAIGVRTFMLFSLLGTLAATLDKLSLTITISAFVFSIIIFGYLRSTANKRKKIDIGVTTEVSAGLVFCLGYMIPSAKLIAITISAFVLLILVERKRLHTLARNKFKPHEIETTIILVIFALGILPLLPNRSIDAWNLFNPRNFGILIITIAAIQFAGYVSIRLFGERFGMAITGFLGGLVSSTAVFANLPHALRTYPKYTFAVAASAIFSILAMLVEVIVIVFVASPALFFTIMYPILVMFIVSIIFSIFLLYSKTEMKHVMPSVSNPINLVSILRSSLFIGVTLILIAVAKRFIGNEGVLLISFLGGLFEIHGITLATALLYLNHQITTNNTIAILYTALLAGFVSKFFLLWSLTPFRFALQTSFLLLCILLSGGVTYWLMFF